MKNEDKEKRKKKLKIATQGKQRKNGAKKAEYKKTFSLLSENKDKNHI